jgi:hypothetical protein
MFLKFNSANSYRYIRTAKKIIYFCFFFLSPFKLWTPIAEALLILSSFIHFNNLISYLLLQPVYLIILSKNKAAIHLTIYNVLFVFLYFVFFAFYIYFLLLSFDPRNQWREWDLKSLPCIHGFIQFRLKSSYILRLTNYRYSIFKERSMLNIKTWRDICKLLYSDHIAYFVL